jgi:hypothetical protein
VSETLDAIAARADQSVARFASAKTNVERDSALETLRLLNGFLGKMTEASDWLSPGNTYEVHIGGLTLIDDAASALIGTDADVVTVPSGADRYATLSWPYPGSLPG